MYLREIGSGLCGHHREVRQRASADESDPVMENAESNEEWIEDDHSRTVLSEFGMATEPLRERFNLCQGVIRTLRSTIEEQWEVELVTYSVWLWIAEQARFLLTRFDLGGDGITAYERL